MPRFVGQQMLFKSFFKNIAMWVLLPRMCWGHMLELVFHDFRRYSEINRTERNDFIKVNICLP